jgi:hypothetical protein
MEPVTLELLNDVIANEGLAYIGTPATVAYLNMVLEPVVTRMNQFTTPVQVMTYAQSWTEIHVTPAMTVDETVERAVRDLTRRIVSALPTAGYATVSNYVEYDALTLTPWEIVEAISEGEGLSQILGYDVPAEHFDLPVSVTVNGNVWTHPMSKDLAMGALLLSRTAGVDLGMTVYGEPLTYFIEGQNDIYLRYNGGATEGESNIRMIGSDRRYYFFGDDFLHGIKTAAEWLGLDHHYYWDSLQDEEGDPMTF